jgi:hypothetical protein
MKKILIVGFACLPLIAVAQTNGTGAAASKNTKASGSREVASGKASGKRGSSDRESSAPSVSEVTMKAPTRGGRESSQPSVSEATVKAPSGGQGHVATGDLNGDGMPDVAASKGSSNGKGQNSANDSLAHGQTSGKRQHEPVRIKKEIDATSPKL